MGPQARELYLEMRYLLIKQTHRFFEKNVAPKVDQTGAKHSVMNLEAFKSWLNHYPFIRTIIREALMPRVWTLKKGPAVQPPVLQATVINSFHASKAGLNANESIDSSGTKQLKKLN